MSNLKNRLLSSVSHVQKVFQNQVSTPQKGVRLSVYGYFTGTEDVVYVDGHPIPFDVWAAHS